MKITRRLATVPVPVDGEALHGYLDRMSYALQTPVGAILRDAHIPTRTVLGGYATCAITKDTADDLESALGLPDGPATRLTLRGRHATLLPSLARARNHMDVNRAAARDWFFIAGSRYCPACLDETGVWQLAWHLPTTVACTHHRVLLADRCPSCGAFPRSAGLDHHGHTAGWEHEARNPKTCPAPRRSPEARRGMGSAPCGGVLTAAVPLRASAPLLRVQELIDDCLQGRKTVLAGVRLNPRRTLLALRELVCLGIRLQTRDHGAEGSRVWRTPQQRTAIVASSLELLEPVWTTPFERAAGEELRRLADRHSVVLDQNYFRDALGSEHAMEPVYAAALARSGRISTRLRRAYEAHQTLDLYPFDPEVVPQLVWPCAVPGTLLNRAGRPSQPMIKAVASLALVRLRTGTWHTAAKALGFPADSGPQWSRYVVANLTRAERNALFDATLATATWLSTTRDLPSYGPRRPVTSARALPTARAGLCSPGCCPHLYPSDRTVDERTDHGPAPLHPRTEGSSDPRRAHHHERGHHQEGGDQPRRRPRGNRSGDTPQLDERNTPGPRDRRT